jgi:hypothetical protein
MGHAISFLLDPPSSIKNFISLKKFPKKPTDISNTPRFTIKDTILRYTNNKSSGANLRTRFHFLRK